jgi:hypothetical protein
MELAETEIRDYSHSLFMAGFHHAPHLLKVGPRVRRLHSVGPEIHAVVPPGLPHENEGGFSKS